MRWAVTYGDSGKGALQLVRGGEEAEHLGASNHIGLGTDQPLRARYLGTRPQNVPALQSPTAEVRGQKTGWKRILKNMSPFLRSWSIWVH